ncbi:bifunctional acetate--CoA ligase family protein/GNAT family N-acetyltransferase [Psychromonas sp. 14N.309.X.WAT.B.A12]|uniref:bifunctional acetate--CoA ligase family protein/GNAT family N-acetyltransferase n=1 Tax=Psychromonas sp. 14N.309.X.WAT.B.A12 TaxID=2998322 RepID=UPI0025B01092|nr:bifunctional acetate--CoA ligase family protein/GNAT family N-acetyltransferase [Psychromonas sp. 14N.309.X.WAT.B.A12]MDN2661995.1 bifunctional acetate--CoA ligase family protein/GNAT family N-acetyltransferase [Psychromonas sp. 14N.309.X.WAT.B.A12]
MSLQSLKHFFNPKSVAVIGASVNIKRAGYLVMNNLLAAGFNGPIMPVTPKHRSVHGVLAYQKISDLPIVPDLAVICTNEARIPDILIALADKGCRAAIIVATEGQASTSSEIYRLAANYHIRLLGMSSLGIISPHSLLNASLAHCNALPGNIAFVSQSAAVCTTVLDWASSKGIGFSAFVSLGDAKDIGFPEVLDYLARDAKTQSILLYIDNIDNARAFVSAARAIAQHKTVLVIKSGSSLLGAKAAALHSRGLFGHDSVYDAAIKRAGLLRVHDLHELFAAVETLAYSRALHGERLAIVSNGGGLGVLAVDNLVEEGGRLAELDAPLMDKLNACLPANWSHNNPIDMIGDADPTRYATALKHLMDSDQVDAILIIHSPSALSNSEETALAIVEAIKQHPRRKQINILTNWTGEAAARPARQIFANAKIPTFRTPTGASTAFMHLVQYRRNKKLLMETPISVPDHIIYDAKAATDFIKEMLIERSKGENDQPVKLSTYCTKPLFDAYHLNTIDTHIALDITDAIEKAKIIGYPLAVKINSPDIQFKSQVHGVMLNINNARELDSALRSIKERVKKALPDAKLTGFTLQKMVASGLALELRVMIKQDAIFGPVIAISQDSDTRDLQTTLENAVVALPPLNMALARYLVIQGIKDKKIKVKQQVQDFDMQAVCLMLTQLSQMLLDNPQIEDLDLNPVLVSGNNVTIVDSQITLIQSEANLPCRFAISPYPKHLEEIIDLKNGQTILLRPITAEDEVRHQLFDNSQTKEDRYKRYFSQRGSMTHEEMAMLTQIDYEREMAFIAVNYSHEEEQDIVAVIRASTDPDNIEAEFGMIVSRDLQGLGMGSLLLNKMIAYQQSKGTRYLVAMTMLNNIGMAKLAKKLGFKIERDIEEGIINMHMELTK